MNKPWGHAAPEISTLINRCGSVKDAEFFLGVEPGLFSKIRNGKHTYSETMKARVLDALSYFPTRKGTTMAATTKEILKYPDDVQKLIDMHGSAHVAEEKANIGHGAFGQIARGKQGYTPQMRQRVEAALKGEPMPKMPSTKGNQKGTPTGPKPVAAECPPLLASLIKAVGSQRAASLLLGVSETSVRMVATGKREMPSEWIIKAKVELGLPVIGSPVTAAPAARPADNGPPFVPWDGKSKGTFKTNAYGKAKPRLIKGAPQPLVDLMKKFEGNASAAARAAGTTGSTLFNWLEGKRPFGEPQQRQVHAAMHDIPPSGTSMGEEFDKYTLGIAIVMLKGTNFDRIADIADILNGKLAFRKNTTTGWLIIYRIPSVEDLMKFKRLALRDATEIVCP